ncbi:MAG: hypothetical protein JJ850_03890 [Kordiimonadaceae bacterium]|nr:hypothetical protein [Kordiimonadaceae bacterium]MBO6568541.1 hypothetical protein [Kordiimonadaceae bacterium]MBO6963730.1 hypothetical protein [Kordiimonadaceae bacterium]
MTRIIAALAAVFIATSVAAQDDQPNTFTMPSAIADGKTIIVDSTLANSQGAFKMEATESIRLTPIGTSGEMATFKATTIAADLTSVEGVPPFLGAVLENMGERSVGRSFEYGADMDGLPLQLTEYSEIGPFMEELSQGVKDWSVQFGEQQGLNEQQMAMLTGFVDQGLAPFLSKDPEVLGRLVLETPQLMFGAAGRQLFEVGYYSENQGTRYMDELQGYLFTVDRWELISHDTDAGEAIVNFEQTLDPAEHEAFLERLTNVLLQQYGEAQATAIQAEVDHYRALQLTRSADYTIDLSTGLVKNGSLRSEKVFKGSTEVENLSFSMRHAE